MSIGRWPLITTEDARAKAVTMLRECRAGNMPSRPKPLHLPSLAEMLPVYAKAKSIKASSATRYEQVLRIHFRDWQARPISDLTSSEFSKHCQTFVMISGSGVVSLGRGLIGAMFKYANAIYNLNLVSPFKCMSAAGLMPLPPVPRVRKLQVGQLQNWCVAVNRLPEKQRDFLMLLAFTGFRRGEAGSIHMSHVDFPSGVLHVPETKTGQPHSLPITPVLKDILQRRLDAVSLSGMLFEGVALDHLSDMAVRVGAPSFMLHDLRKLLATTGQLLGIDDATLRRILNHKAKSGDTLHRHYVSISAEDIVEPLTQIQNQLVHHMSVGKFNR